MLRLHLSDGQTVSYSPSDTQDLRRLQTVLRDLNSQKLIRAVTVSHDQHQHTFGRPTGLEPVFFWVEAVAKNGKVRGGVRITCQAGDTRMTMMVHQNGSSKVAVARVGKQRYNPHVDGARDT